MFPAQADIYVMKRRCFYAFHTSRPQLINQVNRAVDVFFKIDVNIGPELRLRRAL